MQRVNFTPYVGPAFQALRALGCTAVRGRQSHRVHAGFDASAWSRPQIVVYGVSLAAAENVLRGLGWTGDVAVDQK